METTTRFRRGTEEDPVVVELLCSESMHLWALLELAENNFENTTDSDAPRAALKAAMDHAARIEDRAEGGSDVTSIHARHHHGRPQNNFMTPYIRALDGKPLAAAGVAMALSDYFTSGGVRNVSWWIRGHREHLRRERATG